MNKISALIKTDLINIFRDKTLSILFFVPVLLFILIRFGLPELVGIFPVLSAYSWLILAGFCAITAIFPAFMIAFIMLDERDEKVLAVIRVMPISAHLFVFYRMAFIVGFSFIFSFFLIIATGIVSVSVLSALLLSLLYALTSPVAALGVVCFARNKIEGVTLFKGINFIFMLPVISFFIDSSYRYFFGIIPNFWTYQLFFDISNGQTGTMPFLTGFAVHLLYLSVLYRLFRRRVYR